MAIKNFNHVTKTGGRISYHITSPVTYGTESLKLGGDV